MTTDFLLALLGGAIIGIAATTLWAFNGKIAGISGIVGGMLRRRTDHGWRAAFLAGLLAVGVVAAFVAPDSVGALPRAPWLIAVAGLLVGIGTRVGNGCTSGHGVCGISRFSPRSLTATMTFIGAGIFAVWVSNFIPGATP